MTAGTAVTAYILWSPGVLRIDVLKLAYTAGGQRSNSYSVLKERNTHTGERQMPGFESRAFDPPAAQDSPSTSVCSSQQSPPGYMPDGSE